MKVNLRFRNITGIILTGQFLILCGININAQEISRWSERMAKSVMARQPGGITYWDYVTGTYLEGIEEMWRLTGNPVYYNYILSSLDGIISEDGEIQGYRVTDYNIDDIKEGTEVLFIYKNTGLEKYRLAAENVRQQFYNHPRTNEGGFWHKKIYPWQMWLDGLYMGSPFYAEYGRLFHELEDLDDVVHQITQMEKHGRDPETGLLYHGWDESLQQAWADPLTGQSPSFWGRGMGWYAMAMVDVLDYLPQDYEGRDTIIGILQRLAEAVAAYQDPVKKVWWQVVDRGGDVNNYTESSASCMFVYALAKGVRLGYIDQSYEQVAIDGFNGILSEFITENPNGTINLTKTCRSAGLGGNPYRDGSYEYYTETATYTTNDGKGEGPFILAAAEIEMRDSLYPIACLVIDSVTTNGVVLGWSAAPKNADSVIIERSHGDISEEIAVISSDIFNYTDISSLEPGMLYRYRIMAFNNSDTSVASVPALHVALNQGNLPLKATGEQPDDQMINVPTVTELSWSPGAGATFHRVYFGTTDPPPFLSEQVASTFYPGEMDYHTTYFWRVDEGNHIGITEGDTWSFTTRLPDTMVGHWTFDEASGDQVIDSSAYGNHGTIINMVEENHAQGIKGGALYLTGGEYVKIPHSDVLNFGSGDFTLAFYTLLDPQILTSGEEYRFVIKGSHVNDPGGTGLTGKRYEVFLSASSDEIRFAIDDDLSKSRALVTASDLINGNWMHVAAVRKSQNKELRLYINGNVEKLINENTGNIDQPEDLFIGYCLDFPTYLTGYMDELRLYNYALSTTEIKDLIIPPNSAIERIIPGYTGNMDIQILPGSDQIRFSVTVPGKEQIDFTIRDILGRQVSVNSIITNVDGCSVCMISTSGLNPGIYLVTARGQNTFHSTKIRIE